MKMMSRITVAMTVIGLTVLWSSGKWTMSTVIGRGNNMIESTSMNIMKMTTFGWRSGS